MTASIGQPSYSEPREYALLEHALRIGSNRLPAIVMLAASTIAIALAIFHIYAAGFGTPESHSFRSTHLSAMLVLAILLFPLFRKSAGEPLSGPTHGKTAVRWIGFLIDLLLIGLTIAVLIYMLDDIEEFQGREGSLETADIWMGAILVGLVIEATRRTVGWTMVLITIFFILQTLYANHFPGMLYGPPISFEEFIDVQFVRTDGIFGIPILVASTYIVLFIVFGAILIRSGAGQFFIDLAVALTGHLTGGPAKASVVASAFLGTVSGSATANVVTTGSFTIPMMQRLGYRGQFAAAVEACASSGGQITPPIMGAAAFIIAEFLRVDYLTVVLAAVIPALLYFVTIYAMVHLEAEKESIERVRREDLPQLSQVMKRGWHLLLSLIILVAFMIAGFTPMHAAFWAIIAIVVLSFVNEHTRMSAVDILASLESGVRSSIPVTVACACAGIIIGSIFVSGLGLKFTNQVIELAGGSLIALLILTGFAAILLGMGITTTAVYITVAALIVPSLIQSGVNPMAAHMFAFYFGVVSTITPPVALASFAGAAIAGSPPMATAFESARIGIAKYLVPFVFVYNPSLLFQGPLWLTAYSFAAAFIAVWAISAALEGWMFGRLNSALRLLSGAAALALVFPPVTQSFGSYGFAVNAMGAAAIAVLFWMARNGASAIERRIA
jgi:TRAP transporter 4TM/12TM fusion protein